MSAPGCAARAAAVLFAAAAWLGGVALAADYPKPAEGDYVIRDFRFASGESLPELRIHYYTLGTPRRDAHGVVRNAVLILHGTTGSGGSSFGPNLPASCSGPASRSMPRALHRAPRRHRARQVEQAERRSARALPALRLPRHGAGAVPAPDRGLEVNHARLVMGTSMGGMQSWMWGEEHPQFMDAVMPLASVPTQISGRNRLWRRIVIDAIRNDPAWDGGNYRTQPPSLRTAIAMIWLMSSNPVLREREAPTLARADEVIDAYLDKAMSVDDANDVLYAVAASRDYDPGPDLARIEAPLFAVNCADDLVNPPELGILEREIRRVPHGRAIVIPYSDRTRGHGSHTVAALWKQYLEELLKSPER